MNQGKSSEKRKLPVDGIKAVAVRYEKARRNQTTERKEGRA